MSHIDAYNRVSPVECYKLQIIGVYCILVFVLSIFFNSVLLWVFYQNKKLRNSHNTFTIFLTFLNLFGSILQFIFVIPSNFNCRWMFGKIGCYFSGFVMYLAGCLHIYLMTVISIERYLVILKPYLIKKMTSRIKWMAIIVCILLSTFWSTMPFFGWSYYSLEGGLTSCSVDWVENSFSTFTYNLAVWIFAFIIPVTVIIYSNVHSILIVFKKSKVQRLKGARRIKRERRLIITCLFQIFGYMLTWSPYAIVSMYSAFVKSSPLSPLTTTLPGMFAKSSFVWSTVLYIYSNNQIRRKLNIFKKKPAAPLLLKAQIRHKKEPKETTIHWV